MRPCMPTCDMVFAAWQTHVAIMLGRLCRPPPRRKAGCVGTQLFNSHLCS